MGGIYGTEMGRILRVGKFLRDFSTQKINGIF